LIQSGVVGGALLGTLVLVYARSADEPAKQFTRSLLPALIALILCGIVVDMLHIQLETRHGPGIMVGLAAVVEDGGEMIAASFLTALCVMAAWQCR
jgi:hypothetical protein